MSVRPNFGVAHPPGYPLFILLSGGVPVVAAFRFVMDAELESILQQLGSKSGNSRRSSSPLLVWGSSMMRFRDLGSCVSRWIREPGCGRDGGVGVGVAEEEEERSRRKKKTHLPGALCGYAVQPHCSSTPHCHASGC
jgi:hypothetical protein